MSEVIGEHKVTREWVGECLVEVEHFNQFIAFDRMKVTICQSSYIGTRLPYRGLLPKGITENVSFAENSDNLILKKSKQPSINMAKSYRMWPFNQKKCKDPLQCHFWLKSNRRNMIKSVNDNTLPDKLMWVKWATNINIVLTILESVNWGPFQLLQQWHFWGQILVIRCLLAIDYWSTNIRSL